MHLATMSGHLSISSSEATPSMFVSALVQYNSNTNAASSNLRLRWEYRLGSELFAVYNEQRNTLVPQRFPKVQNRALIVKVKRIN